MVLFSLIIPVYNVESYLDNCIKSVIIQNPKDNYLEVILVDDGSSDDSGKICDQYAEEYGFIKTIHKSNGGLSSARNAGLREASGRYVMFMDSDDWWNPKVNLKKILNYVKQHDSTEMFLFTAYDYDSESGYYRRNDHDHLNKLSTLDIKAYYQSLLDNGNLEVSACTKILSRTFLMDNELIFREGLLSEDNEWMMRLLRKLERVDIIDEPLYICRLNREGSITNSIKRKNVEDLLRIVRSSQKYCERHPGYKMKNQEMCYASYLWFSALGLCTLLGRHEQRMIKKKFRKTSGVCVYSNSPKTKLCYLLYKAAGLNLTACVLGIYIRLKRWRRLNRTKVADALVMSL